MLSSVPVYCYHFRETGRENITFLLPQTLKIGRSSLNFREKEIIGLNIQILIGSLIISVIKRDKNPGEPENHATKFHINIPLLDKSPKVGINMQLSVIYYLSQALQ